MIFLTQHALAFRAALRRLFASPLNTVLSLIVIGAALSLPSAGWVLLDNVQEIAGHTASDPQISIFMTTDVAPQDLAEIKKRLTDSSAGRWHLVTKEEALKKLQENNEMSEVISSLPSNPLPDAFVVELANTQPDAAEALADTFSKWPKVAHVQLDSAWVKRLDLFLQIGRLTVLLLASLFGGALIAVTFNTIRLQILAQADEIEVAKLLGATDAYVSRPFLYFGAVQGLLGGGFSLLLLLAAGHLLSPPVHELVSLYGGGFTLKGLSPMTATLIACIGALLGWLGAQFSVAMHVRRAP